MASTSLKRARDAARILNPAERAELARELVASLDGPADPDASSAWTAEIERRLAQLDDGSAAMIDRDELKRRLLASLARG